MEKCCVIIIGGKEKKNARKGIFGFAEKNDVYDDYAQIDSFVFLLYKLKSIYS